MPEVATPNQAEREFETGTDESFKNANATGSEAHNENQRVTYANIKRTYDVYQDLDIQAARQSLIEQTRLNQIASQALQNAVETANMVGKQAIRHADVAADALWTDELNPVTRGAGSNLTAGSRTRQPRHRRERRRRGRGCPGRGRRRRQAGGRDHHAGARHPAADRPGADHRDHGDRQRRQPGAAEDDCVASNRGGYRQAAPPFHRSHKPMNTLLSFSRSFPWSWQPSRPSSKRSRCPARATRNWNSCSTCSSPPMTGART